MTVLSEVLHTELTPLWNNIAASQLQVLYVKCGLEAISWRHRRSYDSRRQRVYSKQLLYMVLASSIALWPLYDTTEWSWRLSAVVPAAVLARLFYKGAVRKDPEDTEVRQFTRSSSPSELLFGPMQFAGVLVYLSLYRFMTEEAAVTAAALGIGDALAPIFGQVFGRHVYHMPLGPVKTMEGSVVGVFLGTVVAMYLFLYMLGIPLLPLRMVLAYAGIAAVVEGTSPGNMDNVLVPVVLHFSIDRVQQWLPA